MVLHVHLRNLHFRFCQNRCALRVVFTLKRTVAYILGHFVAIFGHFKIIRFGWFFYWSIIVTYTFTIPNFMTLLFQEVGGLPQKCPKMAVFCSFFGAVHILNRRRALGVAPLTSPLSELPTHQMLWKSVRVKGLFSCAQQLYKRVCPSVRPSVRRSVRRSVPRFFARLFRRFLGITAPAQPTRLMPGSVSGLVSILAYWLVGW